MKILDLKDNQVVIDPHILSIHEFKVIWDRDKSKNKETAFREFSFLYHYCDLNSAYADYPYDKRKECIIKDVIRKEDWKPDKKIDEAIAKYLELSETDKQRLLKAAKFKINEFATFLRNVPLTVENAETMQTLFKNISTTIQGLDKIEEAVMKESEKNEGHVRGNRTVSMFED